MLTRLGLADSATRSATWPLSTITVALFVNVRVHRVPVGPQPRSERRVELRVPTHRRPVFPTPVIVVRVVLTRGRPALLLICTCCYISSRWCAYRNRSTLPNLHLSDVHCLSLCLGLDSRVPRLDLNRHRSLKRARFRWRLCPRPQPRTNSRRVERRLPSVIATGRSLHAAR